ncbi:CEL lipase, partial [Chloropsis hardwickii]|nr:CEL lipase [Chloropsis hardwickii]
LGLFGSYIDIFRGIPFAAPPKTLEDPKPHPGWDGTLEAKEFKNRCMQMKLTQTDVRGSEDCLYLNIWIPQGKKQISTNLPVMIYIFGGGFLAGGSQGANFLNNYLYDGEEIAVRGNVIVVTINYRLGPLGFLSTGDENLPGNYGLKDQHMAIAWVKRNIRAFGGHGRLRSLYPNPSCFHFAPQTLSPKNKGLFKRAISQSGVGVCSWAIQRDPLLWAKKLGEKVGCPTDNTTILADCLRISDPKTLTLAYHLQLTNLPSKSPSLHSDPSATRGSPSSWQDSGAIARRAEVVLVPFRKGTLMRARAVTFLPFSAFSLLSQALLFPRSGRTYSYVFSQPSRMPAYPSWVGADHMDDLQYVFGKPFATPLGYRPKDRTVSKAMIAYWTNFARTGDPSQGHSDVPVSWPAYSNKGKYYLDINNKMNKNSVKQDLRSRFVTFWNSVYLKLPQVAN